MTSTFSKVDRLAGWSWRLLVIGTVVVVTGMVAVRLRLVLVPVLAALLLTRLLWRPTRKLTNATGTRGLAAACMMLGATAAVGGLIAGGAFIVNERRDDVFDAVDQGWADLEDRIVNLDIVDVDRTELQATREDILNTVREWSGSREVLASGTRVAVEILAGFLLCVILSFFFLKDGAALTGALLRRIEPGVRGEASTRLAGAWDGLGAFLRGATILGAVEGVVVWVAMVVVGAKLGYVVALLTFLSAFVPIVGAIAAGVTAVLVTWATAGPTAALIVGGVMLAVQQLDNDVLAPWIYGRALKVHPVVIILVIASAGAIAGIGGAIVAMPLLSLVAGALAQGTDTDADAGLPEELREEEGSEIR